jgi:hypothetical protein
MRFKSIEDEFHHCDLLGSHLTLSLLRNFFFDLIQFFFSHQKDEELGKLMETITQPMRLKNARRTSLGNFFILNCEIHPIPRYG